MSKPSISIVTAVFNVEKYIRECLLSVLNQTYSDFEHIIIDDNSNDNTVKIIKDLIKNDNRFKLLELKVNRGSGKARNLGIEKAAGKYITFIDGDDMWSNDRLKSHLNFMELNRVNFSHTSYSFIDQDSNEIKTPFIVRAKELSYIDLLKKPEISCLTAMYNQEVLGKMYMSNHRAKQDYALWLSILKSGTKCYPFKKITGFYRQHSSSNTSNKLSLIFPHILFLKETQGFGIIKSIYYKLHWGLNGLIKYKIK